MSDEKPNIDRQRRDVLAVSLALIVLAAAGATPSDRASLFLGAFHLERPVVLVYASWVAWGYFLWRFWQVCRHPFASLKRDALQEVSNVRSYRNECQGLLRSWRKILHAKVQECRQRSQPPGFFGTGIQTIDELIRRGAVVRPTEKWQFFDEFPYQWYTPWSWESSGNEANNIVSSQHGIKLRQIDAGHRKLLVLWSYLRAVVLGEAFADQLLPWIIASSAPVFAVALYLFA